MQAPPGHGTGRGFRLTAGSGRASMQQVNESAAAHPARSEVDESALIARARTGDRDAQDALIRLYAADVYGLTSRLLGDRDLAQDAAQDAFVNALHGLERFRGEASFRTWLLRIALNAARTLGRRQTRRREISIVVASDTAVEGDVANSALGRIDGKKLELLLQKLPTKQRMAVVLRAQNGLSYAEVGDAIGCSEGSARVNYHLGIKRLRELAQS